MDENKKVGGMREDKEKSKKEKGVRLRKMFLLLKF